MGRKPNTSKTPIYEKHENAVIETAEKQRCCILQTNKCPLACLFVCQRNLNCRTIVTGNQFQAFNFFKKNLPHTFALVLDERRAHGDAVHLADPLVLPVAQPPHLLCRETPRLVAVQQSRQDAARVHLSLSRSGMSAEPQILLRAAHRAVT